MSDETYPKMISRHGNYELWEYSDHTRSVEGEGWSFPYESLRALFDALDGQQFENPAKDVYVAEARTWAHFFAEMWRASIENAGPPPAPNVDPPYWLTRSLWIPDIEVMQDRHWAEVRKRIKGKEKR